ncbi:MAG: hypothetical protein JO235_11035 [Chroococcidiopsidaceae cyanobacterium CP_BM_RX_35]|nr:hypothetical protein [Chroococcidiopsidaceae cyanobacterium CP_BM_RX_35]
MKRLVNQELEEERQTINGRIEQASDSKAEQLAREKLNASLTWAAAEERKAKAIKQTGDTLRSEGQKLLGWTVGNFYRLMNKTTLFCLVWNPMLIFWVVIIAYAVPTKMACPQPHGVCHAARKLALSAREVAGIPGLVFSRLRL